MKARNVVLAAEPRGQEVNWISTRMPRGRSATGFVYVAFVIDVFSRRIVGWRIAFAAQ